MERSTMFNAWVIPPYLGPFFIAMSQITRASLLSCSMFKAAIDSEISWIVQFRKYRDEAKENQESCRIQEFTPTLILSPLQQNDLGCTVYMLYLWQAIHKQLLCHHAIPSQSIPRYSQLHGQTLSQIHSAAFQQIHKLTPPNIALCTSDDLSIYLVVRYTRVIPSSLQIGSFDQLMDQLIEKRPTESHAVASQWISIWEVASKIFQKFSLCHFQSQPVTWWLIRGLKFNHTQKSWDC